MDSAYPAGFDYRKVVRRFECLTVHKLRDRSRMEKAVKTQDRLRKLSLGTKSDLAGEIRKWRDKDAPRA